MSFLSNFKFADNEMIFDVNNLNHSLLNALRRLIITDIETLGFRTEYGRESDIIVHKNTSSLHNEFLTHRISLVPIHYNTKEIHSFDKDKYEFYIDVTNKSPKSLDITTEHIKIRDVSKTTPVELTRDQCKSFFPPNKITGDYILLNRLKPNRCGNLEEGENINITMKADKSTGKEHARYNPVCVSVFTNKRDESKIKEEISKRLKEKDISLEAQGNKKMTDEEKDEFIKSFMVSEADRYFHTDSQGEPNSFEFTIESDGRIAPHLIFDKSLFILEERINQFMKNIEDDTNLMIEKSDNVMPAYDFIFENEDYTLSYLYQNYIYQLFQNIENPSVKYVGCNVPHPLENKMVIRVGLHNITLNSDNIKDIFKKTTEYIKKIIHSLQKEMKTNKNFVLDR